METDEKDGSVFVAALVAAAIEKAASGEGAELN
jgi:hypothetical protein